MVRRFLIIVSLIASAASVVATARQLTLIERARAGNGHGENMLFMEFDDADVPQLTERADVIVHGTVVRMYTSMTPDERAIVTNYVVAPIRVLKERVPVVSATRPQQTRELVISHPGGTLVDQRGSFSTIVDAYPLDERFAEGEHVVFFLRAKPDGTFTFAHGPSGAFRVANGVVRSMTKEIAERGGKGPQTPHTLPDLVRSVEFSLRRH